MDSEKTSYWKWLREKISEIQMDADEKKALAFVINERTD